jgi:hypothetical protein
MSSPATPVPSPETVIRHGDPSRGRPRFVEFYGGLGGFGLCVVGGVGFGLCVVVGVPGRPDRSGQPGEREGAVQQATDELPPPGGAGRGPGTIGPGPRPLNSHMKDITLKIGSPSANRAARRGLGPTANPKLSLDPTPLSGPRPTHVSKRNRSESPGRSTTGQMPIWQKRYTGGLCKTLQSAPLQHVSPGQRIS